MQDVIDLAPRGDIVLIGGDFNAKLGVGSPVGRFALGVSNDNGERLTQFCLSNAYFAANAMVDRHPRRQATWKAPNGETRNQIDFILVPTRWVSSVSGCKACPGADLLQTDHSLVAGTLRLKLRKPTPAKRSTRLELTKEGLLSYQIEVTNRFALLEEESDNTGLVDSEAQWQSLEEIVSASAKATLAKRTVPKKPWISHETMAILEQKRGMSRNSPQYRALSAAAKKAVQKDRNAVLSETCNKMSEANRLKDSRGVFVQLKKLTSKVTPTCTAMRGPAGKVMTDTSEILESWRLYCESLYREESTEPTVPLESVETEPVPLSAPGRL